MKQHQYHIHLEWTGNLGIGTQSYTAYERSFTLSTENKPTILGSSDPAFRGDPTKWNPEEMLLASISACHKLWYLHLCAVNNVVVEKYCDDAKAIMNEGNENEVGHFISATLYPKVTISSGSDKEIALRLHKEAHKYCFIANSLNFPIQCEPEIIHKK